MKKFKFIILGIVVVSIICGGVALSKLHKQLTDPDISIHGNNIETFYYSKGTSKKSIKSLESEVEMLKEQYGNAQIYVIKHHSVAQIFICNANKVSGKEYYLDKDGIYYESGERDTTFAEEKVSSSYFWEDTVRQDLSCSTQKMYGLFLNVDNRYGALPAWGVSDNAHVKDMQIEGQKVDEVIDLTYNGTPYYLWIIYDLATDKSASEVQIQ